MQQNSVLMSLYELQKKIKYVFMNYKYESQTITTFVYLWNDKRVYFGAIFRWQKCFEVEEYIFFMTYKYSPLKNMSDSKFN